MAGIFAAGFGLLSPAIVWMEDGVFPDRDLLWSLSDFRCYATDWLAKEIEGKDAFKLFFVEHTGMVGLTKISNWVLDLQLVAAWLLLSFSSSMVIRRIVRIKGEL